MMKIVLIALKDLRIAARDKKGLLLLIAMPLLLIAILGSAFSGSFNNAPKIAAFKVGFIDQDHGQIAKALETVLYSDELKQIILPEAMTEASAREQIQNGDLSGAILLPPHFSEDVLKGTKQTTLQVLSDQGQDLQPLILESIAKSFVNHVNAQQIALSEIISQSTTKTLPTNTAVTNATNTAVTNAINPAQISATLLSELEKNPPKAQEELSNAQVPLKAMQYYSAAMGVMFLLFAGMTGLQSVSAERGQQTLNRFLSTPNSFRTFLLGKFLGIIMIAFTQFIVLGLGTTIFFHVNWGNPVAVLSVALAYAFAVSGMVLALSAWIADVRVATVAWSMTVQIFSLFGGSMVPLNVFPPGMRLIAHFTPNYWGLQAFLQTMQGAAFPWTSIVALLGLGGVTLLVGSLKAEV